MPAWHKITYLYKYYLCEIIGGKRAGHRFRETHDTLRNIILQAQDQEYFFSIFGKNIFSNIVYWLKSGIDRGNIIPQRYVAKSTARN